MINTYLTCVLWLLANTWLKNCPLKRLFLVYTISCKHTQTTIRERILLVIMSSNPWFDRERKKNLFPGEYFWLEALFYSLPLCPCLSYVPAHFHPPVFRHTHPAFCITHLSCLGTWPIAPLFDLKEHGQTLDMKAENRDRVFPVCHSSVVPAKSYGWNVLLCIQGGYVVS